MDLPGAAKYVLGWREQPTVTGFHQDRRLSMYQEPSDVLCPLEALSILRRRVDHAAKLSDEMSGGGSQLPPEIVAHACRYMDAQSIQMRNILTGLVLTENDLGIEGSTAELLSLLQAYNARKSGPQSVSARPR